MKRKWAKIMAILRAKVHPIPNSLSHFGSKIFFSISLWIFKWDSFFEPKLKEMENIAKNLVKEPDTMKKMVSSSSLASSNKGKRC